MDWLTNLTGDIEQLMRSHGQQRTVNANGQNINVTTVQRQEGNTSITIANIDNLGSNNADGDLNDEDDENVPPLEGVPGIQHIHVDIQLDEDEYPEESEQDQA